MGRDLRRFLDLVVGDAWWWCVLKRLARVGAASVGELASWCGVGFESAVTFMRRLEELGVVRLYRGRGFVLYVELEEGYKWLGEFVGYR
ncbi:MAG: hypothetical protein QXP31_05690 [Pyrobaculum sp.]